MKTQRTGHGLMALLLAAALAACGSQSQANEAEDEAAQPTADAPATQEEPARAIDEDAAQPMAEEPAAQESAAQAQAATKPAAQPRTPKQTSPTRVAASTPTADPAEEPTASEEPPTGSEEEAAPEQAPAPPETATVAAGTAVSLTLDKKLSTGTNRMGDRFTATVTRPVIEGSRVLIPEGAVVSGTVTAVQKKDGDKPPMLKIDFQSIEVRGETVPLAATLTSADVETEREMKDEGKKIGGGAAAGGLVGGLLGRNVKSALIGAAVGSAAGTAITLVTREGHAVLPAGSTLKIEVDESLEVRI